MAFPSSAALARTLFVRLGLPTARPLPYFTAFFPAISPPPVAQAPLAAFTPSYHSRARSLPSEHFLLLRRAFRRNALDCWTSPTAVAACSKRSFTSSALRHGIRPYYGRGGSGNSHRGRRTPNWRNWLDAVPGQYIVFGLIAVNVGVFAAWSYGNELANRFRDASWLRFLQRNFTVSWHNISQGRVWTLLTSAFSHEGTAHIFVNMLSLYFMAPAVMAIVGNSAFLGLYLFAGITASTFSLLVNHFVTRNPFYAAHGASGATYGAISFFACAFPRTTFLLFFVVPVPAWACVSGIFAWDVYNGFWRRGGMTDSAGHVGGVLAGVLFFLRKAGRL